MQTVGEREHQATVAVVEDVRDHIEADLHREVRAMRAEIGELKTLLSERHGARGGDPAGT
jgi:voltage-gated sodium channel